MYRLFLGFAFLIVTNAPAIADEGETTVPERDRTYPNTAIGAVIDANKGRVPASGVELVAALKKLGDFLQLAIPFSAVDPHSGLAHPRVVLAMRPSTHPAPLPTISNFTTGFSGGGWGGSRPRPAPKPVTPTVVAAPSHLGQADTNRPQLEGRLFLAANMEMKSPGRPVVKTVEFISWNTQTSKFDFGVMEGLGGGTPALKLLDGKRCFSCHKNRGPILGEAPWSNSVHNPAVRAAAQALLKFPRRLDPLGREDPNAPVLDHMDGPFDTLARANWVKFADRPKRIQVLTRMVQRMATDRDMPPEDSREAELFRGKDFDAAKDWLVAELKKAKG